MPCPATTVTFSLQYSLQLLPFFYQEEVFLSFPLPFFCFPSFLKNRINSYSPHIPSSLASGFQVPRSQVGIRGGHQRWACAASPCISLEYHCGLRLCLMCYGSLVFVGFVHSSHNHHHFFRDRVLRSTGWSRTQYEYQAGFRLVTLLPVPPETRIIGMNHQPALPYTGRSLL